MGTRPRANDLPDSPHLAAWLTTYEQARAGEPSSSTPRGQPGETDLPQRFWRAARCFSLLEQLWGNDSDGSPRDIDARDIRDESGQPPLPPCPVEQRRPEDRSLPDLNVEGGAEWNVTGGIALRGDDSRLRLGRFRIVKQLGRGGHGIVYLALDPGLNRQVAIKVPRPETLGSPELRQRFLRESRAVAALSHPHLISVYEVGVCGPVCFIVAEYCSGPSLSAWLKRRTEPIDGHQAARMVAVLAETVGYVHSRGILHRDIKPANVLLEPDSARSQSDVSSVTGLGGFIPKLTDFGLAKLLDAPSDTTMTGAVIGTPTYMAPEQAQGRIAEISTATDVYSLGAILYELLTGQPPYDAANKADTLRQVVRGQLVPPRHLCPDIARDLEAICLKCLERSPQDRYASAPSLAEDLRRFVTGRTVRARRANPWVRASKWCRRNPLAACLSGALVVALLAGFAAVTWQWRAAVLNQRLAEQHRQQAEENFRQAHLAVKHFQDVLYEGGKYDAPVFQPLRRELLESALNYYHRFLAQRSDEPELLADIADACYHLAFIEQTQGSKTAALEIYQKSVPLWNQLNRVRPNVDEYPYYLAKTYDLIGQLLASHCREDEALGYLRQGLLLRQELVRRRPGATSFQNELAYSHDSLGLWFRRSGQFDEALLSFERARAVREKVAESNPSECYFQRRLGFTYAQIADVKLRVGQPRKALEHCEHSLAILEPLVSQGLEMPSAAGHLAEAYQTRGNIEFQLGHHDGFETPFAKAHDLLARLVRDYPSMAQYRRELAGMYSRLGKLQSAARRPDDALNSFRQARDIRRTLVEQNCELVGYRKFLVISCLAIAEIHASCERGDEALEPLREAELHSKRLVEQVPENLELQALYDRVRDRLLQLKSF